MNLFLKLIFGAIIMFAALQTNAKISVEEFYDLKFNSIDGNKISLEDYRDKTFLVVNTASFCGFTRQFTGLQNIWNKYRKDGLVVIGVPSNDFNQEAKTNTEVKNFCEVNFNVDFIMTETSNVRGENAHPLFKYIEKNLGSRSSPKWNFYKYIIDKNGIPVNVFSSMTKPESSKLINALELELFG